MTKEAFGLNQNMARNLTGALMQDYLIHLVIQRLEPYPELDIFTEVRVPYGTYPLWSAGVIAPTTPMQVVDLAVGYIAQDNNIITRTNPWPQQVISKLQRGQVVFPLLVINSKIRVSQGEFFDWRGREDLLTKGNPDCLSLQVALRSEIDLHIIRASQSTGQFFLLGTGGEAAVVGNSAEIDRLLDTIDKHLSGHM
jgi:hypothetical protein